MDFLHIEEFLLFKQIYLNSTDIFVKKIYKLMWYTKVESMNVLVTLILVFLLIDLCITLRLS